MPDGDLLGHAVDIMWYRCRSKRAVVDPGAWKCQARQKLQEVALEYRRRLSDACGLQKQEGAPGSREEED